MATIRFDAHFGTVIERPWSAEALRGDASALLAEPGAWTWLAEDNGHPVAMLYAVPPAPADWIAPMTGVSPVAYLELMYVQPDDRGQGAGPALVGRLHQEADAAGVAVTLLHYEVVNPLSGPFWSPAGLPAPVDFMGGPAGPDAPLTAAAATGHARRKFPLRASRLRAAGWPAAGATPQCRWPGALSR